MGLIRYSCCRISGHHEPIHVKFGLWGVFHHVLLKIKYGHENAEMQTRKSDDVTLQYSMGESSEPVALHPSPETWWQINLMDTCWYDTSLLGTKCSHLELFTQLICIMCNMHFFSHAVILAITPVSPILWVLWYHTESLYWTLSFHENHAL